MKFNSVARSLIVVFSIVGSFTGCREQQIKQPAVAGAFYPSDARVLRETVDSYLAAAEPKPVEGRLIALLSPHAGYQFSGSVAAYTYKQLRGRDITTVLLIGPSHHVGFNGASVYTKGAMRTPLGDVAIDEALARSILKEDADVVSLPEAFEKEHSLEVQLPFLQRTLKDFRVVPILIGNLTPKCFSYLTSKLTEILARNEKAIIITSTDLSHYHDYDTAVRMDHKAIESVERLSVDILERNLKSGDCEMCGAYPVMVTLGTARNLGANNGVLLRYANSGDTAGDKSRVVGYAAFGLYRSPLSQEDKARLLSLARQTITEYVSKGYVPDIEVHDHRLLANAATFVTIKRHGYLRGCIGNMQPIMPLYRSVIMNAVSASSKDNRFQPMVKEELADMVVEVSILSPFEPLRNIDDIVIGKHGLYLVLGQNSSVFLPEVPVEQGWDLKTYLDNLALKAGLPREAWKDARLYTFTADVIK